MDANIEKVYEKCENKQMELLMKSPVFRNMKTCYVDTFRRLFCVQDPTTYFFVNIDTTMGYIVDLYEYNQEKIRMIKSLNENFGFSDEVMEIYLNEIMKIYSNIPKQKENEESYEKYFDTNDLIDFHCNKDYLNTTRFFMYNSCIKNIIENLPKDMKKEDIFSQIRVDIISARSADFSKFKKSKNKHPYYTTNGIT